MSFSCFVQPVENALKRLEKSVGAERKVIASGLTVFTAISYVFYNYAFMFSFIFCLVYPIANTSYIMSGQASQRDNRRMQAYWFLLSLFSLLDFTFLGGIPIFYFIKSVFFLFTLAGANSNNLLDKVIISLFGVTSHLETPRCPMSPGDKTPVKKD